MFLGGIIVAVLLPAVNALAYWSPPETAGALAFPTTRAQNALSPKPTTPPSEDLVLARLQKRDLSNTCGWWNGLAIDCHPNSYCAYDTQDVLANCCPVDNNGTFTSCSFQSVCYNLSQKNSICGSSDCLDGTVWCADTANPNCLTYHLTGDIAGVSGAYVTFRCGTGSITYRTGDITSPSSSSTSSSSSSTDSSTSEDAAASAAPTGTNTVSAAAVTSTSATATAASSPPSNSHTGAIAGGVVGGVLGLALIVGAIVFVVWRIKTKRAERNADDIPEMTGTVNPR